MRVCPRKFQSVPVEFLKFFSVVVAISCHHVKRICVLHGTNKSIVVCVRIRIPEEIFLHTIGVA